MHKYRTVCSNVASRLYNLMTSDHSLCKHSNLISRIEINVGRIPDAIHRLAYKILDVSNKLTHNPGQRFLDSGGERADIHHILSVTLSQAYGCSYQVGIKPFYILREDDAKGYSTW